MEHPTINLLRKTLLAVLFVLPFAGCYYDNEEELYPNPIACDTSSVTYSGHIAAIMQSNCNTCHNAANASGNVITEDYNNLRTIALNGKLYGSVSHASGFSPMPKGGNKLSECDQARIRIWAAAGAPNN